MKSAVHMASMALRAREGDTRGTQKALEDKREEKRSLEKPKVQRRITLSWICKK
jgi:hypothetical protein